MSTKWTEQTIKINVKIRRPNVFCDAGLLQSFLWQAADSNSKRHCKNQASQQTFGPYCFVKALDKDTMWKNVA